MITTQNTDDFPGVCGNRTEKRSYTDISRDTPSSRESWRDAEFLALTPRSPAKPIDPDELPRDQRG